MGGKGVQRRSEGGLGSGSLGKSRRTCGLRFWDSEKAGVGTDL